MKRLTIAASLALSALALLFAVSCSKTTSCYDPALARQYESAFCTADCPGVIGCDGKTYCNECEAARRGIRVK